MQYLSGDEVVFSKVYEEKHFTLQIPETVEKVSLKIRGDEDTYTYFIGEMREQGRCEFARSSAAHNDFALEDKTTCLRRYDPEDGHCVTEEMIFPDFLKQGYSDKYFKQIDLSFDTVPNKIFRIKTHKAATCFCQLNYLGIEYSRKVYKGKGDIDFGTITIEAVDQD